MPVIQTSGGGFMLNRHGLHDTSPFVYTARDAPASGAAFPLIIVGDLVESVQGAGSIVQDVLTGMSAFLRHELERGDPHVAIKRAFAAANERVLEENSLRSGLRKIYLGLTCVVMHHDEIHVAQCAPGQLLVWQDGILHAIPQLSSWSARDITGTFSSLSFPLGFRSDSQPRTSYSSCAAGDVIAVVSWQFARYLHDNDFDVQFHPSELPRALEQLRRQDKGLSVYGAIFKIDQSRNAGVSNIDRLALDESSLTGESGDEQGSEGNRGAHVTAPGVVVGTELQRKSGGDHTANFDTLETGHLSYEFTDDLPLVRSGHLRVPEEADYVELDSSIMRFSRSGDTDSLPESAGRVGRTESNTSAVGPLRHEQRPPAREGYSVEIFAGLLLFLSAAVVGVWQATKRDRPIHGPRDDGTLGLPHLQRWSDSYQRPRFERVRSVSPRFQINGFLMIGAAVAVVALAGVLVFNALSSRSESHLGGLEERLQSIVSVRTQTDTTVPSTTSYETLLGAQVALDELAEATTSDELLARIGDEQAAVATALNELAGIVQLNSVQVLGALPPVPEGVIPRLFSGGGRVFVVGDALYELDQITGTLILLLASGDLVDGEPVGTILAATWNDDRPLAADSHNLFMQDPADGNWHRASLGVFDDTGHINVTAIATFNRNVYFLTSDTGQILKFDALDFSATPEDWAAGSAREQLQSAVDIMIDGNIRTVLTDGQVLTFFRSTLDAAVIPQVMPALESVAAFTSVAEGQFFFMIDAADGRIVGVRTDGELYRQFVTSPGLPTLEDATDIVINESNGISYVLADNTIYMVRLTLPVPSSE